jgi:GAF domain-containing protein
MGAPLLTPDDYALGTLCVIDRKARPDPSQEQKQVLRDLAGIVMHHMETRRILRQNQTAARQAKSAVNSVIEALDKSRAALSTDLAGDLRHVAAILDGFETSPRMN